MLERAIDRLYDKHEAAARDMGVSPSQLSKWLAGKERFALIDLDRCVPVRVEFMRLLAEDCGFDARPLDARQRRRREIESLQRRLFELQVEDREDAMREAV